MAAWSQVYNDGAALVYARRRARGLLIGFAAVSGLLVSAAPLATIVGRAHAGAVVLICGSLLSFCAALVLIRLARLHRRSCRFEISTLGVAATDTAGRRTALLWRTVDAVDLNDDAVVISGQDVNGRPLEIRALRTIPRFDDFARFAVSCAHAHRCPLWIDGEPVDTLPLSGLTARPQAQRGGPAEPAG